MPIHDQGYRRYQGARTPRGRAWAVITTAGLRTFFGKRAFLALLLLSWLPFVVRTVQMYAAANFPQMAFMAPTAETFRQFMSQQDPFVFFVTVYVGAGLIANDRRANALQIYLSKPLLRIEYIAGKLAILVTFLLGITLVPALLLILLQIGFSGSFDFLRQHLFLVPAVVLGSLTYVCVSSFTMVALSSLSKSARYAALLFTGAIFFGDALFGALRIITGSSRVAWVSIGTNISQVNDVIFKQKAVYDSPWSVSLMVILGLLVLSISVLERRVRGVEVVK